MRVSSKGDVGRGHGPPEIDVRGKKACQDKGGMKVALAGDNKPYELKTSERPHPRPLAGQGGGYSGGTGGKSSSSEAGAIGGGVGKWARSSTLEGKRKVD